MEKQNESQNNAIKLMLDNLEKLEEKIKQLQSEKTSLIKEKSNSEKLNRRYLQDIQGLRENITLLETTIEANRQEIEQTKNRKWHQKIWR